MPRAVIAAALLSGFLSGSCAAGRTFSHDAPAEDLPHFSWELSAGAASCASGKSDAPCELPASTAEQPRTVTFNLILHAIPGGEVTYTGTYRATFAATPRPQTVEQSLPAGTSVKVVALIDTVTSTSGSYGVEIDLSATYGATTQPLKAVIPVTVR
jgi:hypothetical protein